MLREPSRASTSSPTPGSCEPLGDRVVLTRRGRLLASDVTRPPARARVDTRTRVAPRSGQARRLALGTTSSANDRPRRTQGRDPAGDRRAVRRDARSRSARRRSRARAGLGVSSATVRNEMTVLEREGYIAQPHTSAGRVPTDRGYRYFVDHFAGQGALAAPAAPAQSPTSSRRATTAPWTTCCTRRASCSPASAAHAAVVVGPEHRARQRAQRRSSCACSRALVLAVVVLSNGAVEKDVLHLAADVDDAVVASRGGSRSTRSSTARAGRSSPTPAPTGDDARRHARAAARATRSRARGEHEAPSRSTSAARAASPPSTRRSPATTAARLLELLEQQVVLVVAGARAARPRAHGVASAPRTSSTTCASARSCSRRTSSTARSAGTVGVLGPTRMDYRKAQAAVHGGLATTRPRSSRERRVRP